MFRRLLLPLAATALLAGCVTSAPYGYRGDGQGDYYYGSPSVEYRYGNGYPGYGDPYYGPYRSGFSVWGSTGYYGRPYGPGYGYGYPGYGNPYYGNPYYGGYYGYPRQTHRPRPDHDDDHDRDDHGSNQPNGGPWRNLDEINRRRHADNGGGNVPRPAMPQPQPQFTPPPRPMPRMDEGGSPVGQVIRRGRRSSQSDE